MTISKAQLKQAAEESYQHGRFFGKKEGREEKEKEMQEIRKNAVIEISSAVADLALANAKLTYALSRITDKLL